MRGLVFDEVDVSLTETLPPNSCEFLEINKSRVKSRLKEAAKRHGVKYRKEWIALLPAYLTAAGWKVEAANWGYRLFPKELSIESGDSYGGVCEEERVRSDP